MKRVLITGAESTGKSELSQALSEHYGGIMVPEYAREYVQNLDRDYSYDDVEHIARWQQKSYEREFPYGSYVFFDTWLIITRVWFEVVFQKVPSWIDQEIGQAGFDLVLLCHTDLPWVADGLRENGGRMRMMLQKRYLELIRGRGWTYGIVKGRGEDRLKNAIQWMDRTIGDDKS